MYCRNVYAMTAGVPGLVLGVGSWLAVGQNAAIANKRRKATATGWVLHRAGDVRIDNVRKTLLIKGEWP